MRRSAIALTIATLFSTAAPAQDDCPCWIPNAATVATVEAKIRVRQLPLGSIDNYVRYYAGVTGSGGVDRFIWGKLVPRRSNETPEIQVAERKLPPLQGEGCISRSDSAGRGVQLRCARLGAWSPSATEIAELEQALRRNGAKGIDKLDGYARHYAGVTEGDERIIAGVLLMGFDYTPGLYVESEAELPTISDGGCSVVDVRYVPSTKTITAQCHGDA
jgi:hypothetical protein